MLILIKVFFYNYVNTTKLLNPYCSKSLTRASGEAWQERNDVHSSEARGQRSTPLGTREAVGLTRNERRKVLPLPRVGSHCNRLTYLFYIKPWFFFRLQGRSWSIASVLICKHLYQYVCIKQYICEVSSFQFSNKLCMKIKHIHINMLNNNQNPRNRNKRNVQKYIKVTNHLSLLQPLVYTDCAHTSSQMCHINILFLLSKLTLYHLKQCLMLKSHGKRTVPPSPHITPDRSWRDYIKLSNKLHHS